MAPILDATPHHGEAWVEPVQQELVRNILGFCNNGTADQSFFS
jgi:hypothetical protein